MAAISRVFATFLLPAVLCGSSFPRLSVEELVRQSDVIARGRIVRSWTAMDTENRFIWTHYQVRVSGVLKGQPATSLEIAEPGGTLNGITLLTPGAAHYRLHEEIAVFLYRTPLGYLRTTNYGEGKFTITVDDRIRANGEMNVVGADFVKRIQPAPGAGVESLDGLSWSQFASRIARAGANREARR